MEKWINPLCWMFEYQFPSWLWNNNVLARIFYTLHWWTCPDKLFLLTLEKEGEKQK